MNVGKSTKNFVYNRSKRLLEELVIDHLNGIMVHINLY
jgi:hypothetical protein